MANGSAPQSTEVRRVSSRPDRVLPWHDLGPTPRKRGPEELLMIAVLNDALECLEKHRFATDGTKRRIFRQARRWFLDGDTEWPYSFERICGALDLDTTRLRRRIAIRATAQRQAAALALVASRHHQASQPARASRK